jgi:tetratricopeptide (TPR) repeat protein
MSRFVNLEFGGEEEGHFEEQPALKDESWHLSEAQTAFVEGRFEQALRSFSRVLEFNPQNVTAWSGQVRMLIELGEFHEAKVWADKALESFPRDPELLAAKAVALGRTGDLNSALAFSDAAIEERGDTPYIWLARGDVLLARNEKRADYCFEKAHLLAPRDWLVHWLAARIRFYYGKFAVALKVAQQALTLDSARAVLWLEVGRCQEALGLTALAQASYEQALQLQPGCEDAARALRELRVPGFCGTLQGLWRRLFAQ